MWNKRLSFCGSECVCDILRLEKNLLGMDCCHSSSKTTPNTSISWLRGEGGPPDWVEASLPRRDDLLISYGPAWLPALSADVEGQMMREVTGPELCDPATFVLKGPHRLASPETLVSLQDVTLPWPLPFISRTWLNILNSRLPSDKSRNPPCAGKLLCIFVFTYVLFHYNDKSYEFVLFFTSPDWLSRLLQSRLQ